MFYRIYIIFSYESLFLSNILQNVRFHRYNNTYFSTFFKHNAELPSTMPAIIIRTNNVNAIDDQVLSL